MRTSIEIGKEIQSLQARAEAIVAMAKEESRDLNAEETQEIDSIVGTDAESGKISALRKDHSRMLRIESAAVDIVKKQEAAEAQPVKVPARAKAKAPVGFESAEDAYLMGNWALAAFNGNSRSKRICKDHGIKAALSTGNNTLGGFLVPEPLSAAIVELRELYGVFRQNATVVPMSDATLTIPRLASEVTAYYVGENTSITASDPTLASIKLDAKKLATLTVMSNEVNEDAAISLAEMLSRSIGQSFAIAEDAAGFLGDGTSTYGGIQGLVSALAAGSQYTATSRTTFSALTMADFESMMGQAKQWAGYQPKWYMSKAGYAASAMRLADAVGGNTNVTIANGPSMVSFLGYPVVFCQGLESRLTGTTGGTFGFFGDLREGVYMGSRKDITLAIDSSRYFDQDSIALRAVQRFDIRCFDVGTASVSGGIIRGIFG
jgi:HK97 family phage major capsid protein